jgi:hypothetical protein
MNTEHLLTKQIGNHTRPTRGNFGLDVITEQYMITRTEELGAFFEAAKYELPPA